MSAQEIILMPVSVLGEPENRYTEGEIAIFLRAKGLRKQIGDGKNVKLNKTLLMQDTGENWQQELEITHSTAWYDKYLMDWTEE